MADDRMPGDWHRLHPDEYEMAVAEGAGAWAGTFYGHGETMPVLTDAMHAALRAAVAVAFCWGYSAGVVAEQAIRTGGTP